MTEIPEWLAVVLLGLIEGVTEFLPISSTGHLLIPQNLGWLPAQGDLFNVGIQSGAVLAVLAVFTSRVRQWLTTLAEPATRDYLLKLFCAFVLTSIGALVIEKLDVSLPEEVAPVAWATLIGAFVIFACEAWRKNHVGKVEITWTVVVVVGLAQVVAAAFPGTSRSGASILAAMAFGMARPAATEFSFLLGVPTLMAAGGYKMLSALRDGSAAEVNWSMLLLGTVVSAVSAFLVVRWLIRFVQSHTFNGFAWYRLILGAALLAWVYLGSPGAAD